MRVLALWLQFHQVNNVDDANPQRRKMLAEEIYGSQRFQRWYVSATGHHHVWFSFFVIARPFPDADASGAMFDRLIHRQPLRSGLFACYHNVDIVAAAQAMIGHRKERVRVRRKINADDLCFLVYNVIDEPRILVADSVVILPPDVGRQEIIERGDGSTPWYCVSRLPPLLMLIEHRVDDVDKRLVAGKQPVPAS